MLYYNNYMAISEIHNSKDLKQDSVFQDLYCITVLSRGKFTILEEGFLRPRKRKFQLEIFSC